MTASLRVVSDTGRNGPEVIARDLFASPILVCKWPNTERLNAELRAAIMERYASTPSVVQSARHAWQSEHRMHEWPEACVKEFASMIRVAAANMAAHLAPSAGQESLADWEIVSCFANVNPPGGYSQAHNHIETGATISGVYYVDIGDCEPRFAGRTVFQDYSGAAQLVRAGQDTLSREYALVPTPGAACLFTATQMHYVEPYRGKGVRISIAFNMRHPDFDVLYYPNMRTPSWWWRNFRGLMILRDKIPQKLKALALFASYGAKELGGSNREGTLAQRLRNALQRADVDAQSRKGPDKVGDGQLAEKKPLV